MTVVHICKAPFSHYIGRRNKRFRVVRDSDSGLFRVFRNLSGGAGLPDSALRNPYAITPERDRSTVMSVFEVYARAELMKLIRQLPVDGVLGCWCAPQGCHGDVIIKLWNEMHEAEAA